MKPKTKAYVDRRLEATAHQLCMMLDNVDTRLSALEQLEEPLTGLPPPNPNPESLPFVDETGKMEWTGVADLTASQIYDGLVNEKLVALFDAIWSKERASLEARIAKLEGDLATMRANVEMGE